MRLYLFDGHYRRPFDHDEARLERARGRAKKLESTLGRGRLGPIGRDAATREVLAALDDDLDTRRAIRALERASPANDDARASLRTLAKRVLGIL